MVKKLLRIVRLWEERNGVERSKGGKNLRSKGKKVEEKREYRFKIKEVRRRKKNCKKVEQGEKNKRIKKVLNKKKESRRQHK